MKIDAYSLASAIWEVGAAQKNIVLHLGRGKKKMHNYVPRSECFKCIRTQRRYTDAVANLIIQMILIGRR